MKLLITFCTLLLVLATVIFVVNNIAHGPEDHDDQTDRDNTLSELDWLTTIHSQRINYYGQVEYLVSDFHEVCRFPLLHS